MISKLEMLKLSIVIGISGDQYADCINYEFQIKLQVRGLLVTQ